MTLIKAIEPGEWDTFLNAFSERNRGRRARFEIFSQGDFAEEEREAALENVAMTGNTVTVKRSYVSGDRERSMTDELTNIQGVAVQYDTDNSEAMLEFTDDRNAMTTLHFESRIDGDN